MLFQLSTCKPLTKKGTYSGNMLVGSIQPESQKLVDIFFPEFISKNLALVDHVENHITNGKNYIYVSIQKNVIYVKPQNVTMMQVQLGS